MSALSILVLTISIISTLSTSVFRPDDRANLLEALNSCCTTHSGGVFDNDCTYEGTHIRDWDTSSITDMNSLFSQPVTLVHTDTHLVGSDDAFGGYDVYHTINQGLTCGSTFNANISQWHVSQVTNMSSMFHDATTFNQPIGNWNVNKVTDMYKMFESAMQFNQPIGNWKVGKVTNMYGMFYNAVRFNQPLNLWDISKVTNIAAMFMFSFRFNQDLNDWNPISVTKCSRFLDKAVSMNYDHTDLKMPVTCVKSFFDPTTAGNPGTCTNRRSFATMWDNPPHWYKDDDSVDTGKFIPMSVQCSSSTVANSDSTSCVAEGCVNDNSICCNPPCGHLTSVTDCAAGPSVCWWDADDLECRRVCGKRYKSETDRICSDNTKELHVLTQTC